MDILKVIDVGRIDSYERTTMDFVNSMTRHKLEVRGIYESIWGPLIGFFTVLGLTIGENDE